LWQIDPAHAEAVAPELGSDVPAALLALPLRGEGAGVVLLKPLRTALAEGDRIHAIVRATAVKGIDAVAGETAVAEARQALRTIT